MAEMRKGQAEKPGRSAKKATTYDELMALARNYGVDQNALFVSAAKQYQLQQEVLDMIRETLRTDGETVTTKEYVKGRENVCVHPLIAQLPKHVDSANRTLTTMLDIVQKLGRQSTSEDGLNSFRL